MEITQLQLVGFILSLVGAGGVLTGEITVSAGIGGPKTTNWKPWKPWKSRSVTFKNNSVRWVSACMLVAGFYIALYTKGGEVVFTL